METEMIRAAGAQPGGEWRFSVLDRACLNMVIKGMWLFHGRLDAAAMKESFARLLGYYPHLCGRVMRGEAVACDNSGVPFAVDEAPRCRLEQAVLMPDAPKRFGAHFDLSGFKRGRQAPLSVRLTRLADGTVLSLYVRMAAWTAMRSIRWWRIGAGCTAANRWCSPLRTNPCCRSSQPCLRRSFFAV